MSTMTGIVEQVSTKDVTTKFGLKPTFSFKINGTWIKHGFKNPMVSVGDEVEFDGVSGTYGIETKAVKVLGRATGGVPSTASSAAPSVPKSSSGSYGSRVFPIPPLHGDRSIVRQNALARATEVIVAARGGKPFDVDHLFTDVIIAIARSFEAYTAGDLDLAAATAESKEEESHD